MAHARIHLAEGDITKVPADAIVNAANSSLLGGGGVDGAIHRVGGPEILAECRKLRAAHYGGGLPVGQAVATTAGRLPARWVIHTVGPVHSATEDRTSLLVDCHRNALRVADELGAASIAFPAISTGVYHWPIADRRCGAHRVEYGGRRRYQGDGHPFRPLRRGCLCRLRALSQ